MASNIFHESKRFQKGRKLSRRLDDAAVTRAKITAIDSDRKESEKILQELRDKQEPRIQACRDTECAR